MSIPVTAGVVFGFDVFTFRKITKTGEQCKQKVALSGIYRFLGCMNHFSHALNALLEKADISQREVSKRSGVSQSKIIRWKSAETLAVDPDDLERLARALTPVLSEQCDLIIAHLRDEMPDLFRPYITLEKDGDLRVEEVQSDYAAPDELTPEIREIVSYIARKAVRDPELLIHLRYLHKMAKALNGE